MKKFTKIVLASTIFAATVFAGSQAFAKTEGSYLGVDLLHATSSHQYGKDGIRSINYPKFEDSAIGYGLNYKYAVNFNSFFFAPSLFAEQLGTKAADKDRDTISVNHRYGIKLDFGYDISDSFAMYLTAGVANVSYNVDWKSINQKKSGNKVAFIGGVGASYYPHPNLALNLEYNIQELDVATPDFGGINQAKTNVSVVKLGAAYHF